jgi:hypothetical protein
VGKYKLQNFRGNYLISTLAAFVFVPSVFDEIADFGMIPAETAYWDIGRK